MSLLQLFEEIKQKEWIEIPEGWLQGRTVLVVLLLDYSCKKPAAIFKIQIKDY